MDSLPFGLGSQLGPPRVRVVRYEDDNRRVYKTVPMRVPAAEGWRCDVNYSARTKDGRVILDALPADDNGEYCAVLLLKADDEFAQPGSDARGLRGLLDETLPQVRVRVLGSGEGVRVRVRVLG